MLYPLKFHPVYKELIWGDKKLREKFGKDIPSDHTGESWEVACHGNGTSTVANGPLKGKLLSEIIQTYGMNLLGTRIGEEGSKKFPLLIKILDASDKLSVQVHPGDEYALSNENGELGKTEMWYVIDAEPDSQLVYGVRAGVTREQFKQAILKGTLQKKLNFVNVEPGDVYFIPANTLHAIGKGILIAEIQQNSDTTYRVYDWNRVGSDGQPRQLHIKKALDVTNLQNVTGYEKVKGLPVYEGDNVRTYLVACKYFATEKIDIKSVNNESLNGERFDILMVIKGEGIIKYNGGTENFKSGDTFLMPANLGDYSIIGNCTIIKSYVPDVKKDIIVPLTEKGISKQELRKIGGISQS